MYKKFITLLLLFSTIFGRYVTIKNNTNYKVNGTIYYGRGGGCDTDNFAIEAGSTASVRAGSCLIGSITATIKDKDGDQEAGAYKSPGTMLSNFQINGPATSEPKYTVERVK